MKKQLLALLFAAALSPLALADVRIGVSIAQVDDVFLAQMRDYMAAHAKQLPGVTLQFEDAQGDVVRQLNRCRTSPARGWTRSSSTRWTPPPRPRSPTTPRRPTFPWCT